MGMRERAQSSQGRELRRKARNGKGEDGRAGVRIRSKEEMRPDSGQGRDFEAEYGGKVTERKMLVQVRCNQ